MKSSISQSERIAELERLVAELTTEVTELRVNVFGWEQVCLALIRARGDGYPEPTPRYRHLHLVRGDTG